MTQRMLDNTTLSLVSRVDLSTGTIFQATGSIKLIIYINTMCKWIQIIMCFRIVSWMSMNVALGLGITRSKKDDGWKRQGCGKGCTSITD